MLLAFPPVSPEHRARSPRSVFILQRKTIVWVYGHYEYFNYLSARIDFRRHNLTSADIKSLSLCLYNMESLRNQDAAYSDD